MDHFNSMLPEVKFASYLEDLPMLRRLVAYKLKVSCIKANPYDTYICHLPLTIPASHDVCHS